ncbi:MAG TPA: M28 family metallopeptidase [Herpetosiphonaceae bacterium]
MPMKRLLILALVLLFGTLVPIASADDITNTQGFRKAVTVEAIRQHQAALQSIASASGGNRLAGMPGHDASAQYVYDQAVAAGYDVRFQEFQFLLVADRTAPILQQVSPVAQTYINGVDFGTLTYSGSGDVTAPLTAVDLIVPSPQDNASTSGCEAADFAGFPAGSIALLQRGTCTFRIKATNAAAAGAVGVIVFNEGNPTRSGLLGGTLNAPLFHLPVVGTTFALGNTLRNGVLNGPTGVQVRLRTDTIAENRMTRNVIAETPGGDPNRVIVIGAHLDSVSRGPGINDNGSGSAAILEVAKMFAQHERETRNKLRFIWFTAEELGLIGSTYYVNNLSQAERAKIQLNLNFDMIGSPNFVRFVYDGNNSAFAPPNAQRGPAGSGAIEQVFLDYFASQGLAVAPTPFNGRSDYGPFITNGIPAGGLFTGAEGIKSAAQAAVYGGTAGQQFDPCYHLACDTFDNNSNTALDQMSDAVAHAVLSFSKRNFDREPLVDPALVPDSGSGGGGGLHDDHDHDAEM